MDARIRRDRELGAAPGFVTLDEEAVYEGVHVFSRYFFSRPGDRVVVIRAAANASDWNVLVDRIMSTVSSLRADPLGANAPAAPPPPPAPVIEPTPDATAQIRVLSRAASRDDAMNLTIGRDHKRTGHIRIFEAWAIRLAGLSSAGEVRLIPGTPAPTPTPRPATTRRPTTATPRPTLRPSGSISPRPSGSLSPRPSATGATGTATSSTPRPSPTATAVPLVTATPTPRP